MGGAECAGAGGEGSGARSPNLPPPDSGPKPGLGLGLAVFPTPQRGATSWPEDRGAGTGAGVWEREPGLARADGR